MRWERDVVTAGTGGRCRGPARAARRGAAALAGDVAEVLWPTRCVGCDLPEELLCEGCRRALPWVGQAQACPTCGAPAGWLACTACDGPWPELASVVCATSFEGVAARMVRCLKDEGETRLAPVLAAAMACALDEASAWEAADGTARFSAAATDALCFVPATPRAWARRGFDHMELAARPLAAFLGLPVADVLVRPAGRDQRRLGRSERRGNARGAVRVAGDVSGMRLLLVDDVLTTGASMRSCAAALLGAGARSVAGCAFARVW